ncbi:LuxR C-terminal-related transcriptional regulator [Nocardia tengchongensis]|uniref:LuxR C-terminal-related transcriptional regulator n=1 Tax=Nocardia tengchongensis TaxID=2055889 RepID=UPI00369BD585
MTTVRVLLADRDPISRQVLSEVLDRADGLLLANAIDHGRGVEDWPLRDIDVVVVALGADDDFAAALAALVAVGVRVILLGISWDRRRLDDALRLGALGCLVKTSTPTNLASAVAAVHDRHRVLAPELLDLYLEVPKDPVARGGSNANRLATLTVREREVLELLGDSASTEEVAELLAVSPSTVKSHVSRALTKLGARNRLEAVLFIRNTEVPATESGAPRHTRHAPAPSASMRELARW